jgi:hypothetical protein
MAFNNDNFSMIGIATTASTPKLYSYATTDDNLAAASASAYFNSKVSLLEDGDLIQIKASDAKGLFYINKSNGNITVSAV